MRIALQWSFSPIEFAIAKSRLRRVYNIRVELFIQYCVTSAADDWAESFFFTTRGESLHQRHHKQEQIITLRLSREIEENFLGLFYIIHTRHGLLSVLTIVLRMEMRSIYASWGHTYHLMGLSNRLLLWKLVGFHCIVLTSHFRIRIYNIALRKKKTL